jgi:hypothetical protein
MFRVYAAGNFSEICYNCVERLKQEGKEIGYNIYLSEYYSLSRSYDSCQICGNTFFVDGRKNIKKIADYSF